MPPENSPPDGGGKAPEPPEPDPPDPAPRPDQRTAADLPEEQRQEVVRDILPIEEVIESDITSENIIIEDDGGVRLDDHAQRVLAAEEIDDEVSGSVGTEDVVRDDEGGFDLSDEYRREQAADQLDEQYEGRDITPDDVVERGDGFGVSDDVRRDEAADEYDDEFEDVDVGADDIVETDDGLTVSDDVVQQQAAEELDPQFEDVDVGADDIIETDNGLTVRDDVVEAQAAAELDEQFSGPLLPDVVNEGVREFARREFEGDIDRPDIDIGREDVEVDGDGAELTETVESEIARAQQAARLDIRTDEDITADDFAVDEGGNIVPDEDAQEARQELFREDVAEQFDEQTQTDVGEDDVVIEQEEDQVSARLSREAQEQEAVEKLLNELEEQNADPEAFENIVVEETEDGVVARVGEPEQEDISIQPVDGADEFGTGQFVGTETVDPVFGRASTGDGVAAFGAAAALEDQIADLPGAGAVGDLVSGAGSTAVDAGSGLADLTSPVSEPIIDTSEDAREAIVEERINPAFEGGGGPDVFEETIDSIPGSDIAGDVLGGVPGASGAARGTSEGAKAFLTALTDFTVGAPSLAASATDTATDAAVFAGEQVSDEGVVEGIGEISEAGKTVGRVAQESAVASFRADPAGGLGRLAGLTAAGLGAGVAARSAARQTANLGQRAASLSRGDIDTPPSPRQQDQINALRQLDAEEHGVGALGGRGDRVVDIVFDDSDAFRGLDKPDRQGARPPDEVLPERPQSTASGDLPLRGDIESAGSVRSFLRGEDIPGPRITEDMIPSRFREFVTDDRAQAQLVGRQRRRSDNDDNPLQEFEEFSNARRRQEQARRRELQDDLDTPTDDPAWRSESPGRIEQRTRQRQDNSPSTTEATANSQLPELAGVGALQDVVGGGLEPSPQPTILDDVTTPEEQEEAVATLPIDEVGDTGLVAEAVEPSISENLITSPRVEIGLDDDVLTRPGTITDVRPDTETVGDTVPGTETRVDTVPETSTGTTTETTTDTVPDTVIESGINQGANTVTDTTSERITTNRINKRRKRFRINIGLPDSEDDEVPGLLPEETAAADRQVRDLPDPSEDLLGIDDIGDDLI